MSEIKKGNIEPIQLDKLNKKAITEILMLDLKAQQEEIDKLGKEKPKLNDKKSSRKGQD